jgi:transcriptional activator HAC1
MNFQQASPLQASPAESFITTPGAEFNEYSPLFAVASPNEWTTMDPSEMMTPPSDRHRSVSLVPETAELPFSPSTPSATTTTTDKKPPQKKRKSWGQQLPEPKTNLPPRKRAKTEDEKEQRRVERVLRNRKAAQSSRERKRKEVEGLEERNKELEALVSKYRAREARLMAEVTRLKNGSSDDDVSICDDVSLSQELFSSQDSIKLEDLTDIPATPQLTVNPASLSPELGPVPDADQEAVNDPADQAESSETTSKQASDPTRHSAAVMCIDLQCQSEALPRLSPDSLAQSSLLALTPQLRMMYLFTLAAISTWQQPMFQMCLALKSKSSLRATRPPATIL